MDILGIGECMIELYADGPLASVVNLKRQLGGDVYNTLVTASRLGNSSGFITKLAMDELGKLLLEHFETNKIITRYVQKGMSGVNGLYISSIKDNGTHEFVYYRKNSAASKIQPENITNDIIKQAQIIYSTGITQAISKSARETVLKAFKLAKKEKKIVVYDPNYRPALWSKQDEAFEAAVEVLPYVDVMLPTETDLNYLFGFDDMNHMTAYFQSKGVSIVVLKQGKDGATLFWKDQIEKIPSFNIETVKDTIGAGDAFNGGFIHGLLHKKSLLESAGIGSAVAALSLRERGPIEGLPFWNEVEEVLQTSYLCKC